LYSIYAAARDGGLAREPVGQTVCACDPALEYQPSPPSFRQSRHGSPRRSTDVMTVQNPRLERPL